MNNYIGISIIVLVVLSAPIVREWLSSMWKKIKPEGQGKEVA